ncbi:restriction endonuclease subunit S [Histophilus somni]|uniref:restriction endonuclease subunit S n=1 Tax=Histophilus somni TaxID=731 RepID=UPI00094B7821|nr:restriction endonuclease subunit S [Histophilus somni]
MNNEKRLVPKLRFPEFTHAWEQRKLGEAFVQTSEYINPKKHNAELWSLTVENGLTPKTERYQRDFLVKKEDSFKLVHTNEFVYNPMNMTLGAVGYNDMPYSVAISGYYVTMKTSHITDDLYMKVWLKTSQAISLYKENATGSLIEKQRVQFNTFSKIQFHLPNPQEQQKIGTFFTALDRYITIHQRKLENIQKLKKSLLQKMFPKNDQEFPEIRFPEFTYAWEQRKLGEVVEIIMGQSPNSENYTNNPKDHILVQGNADIKNGKVFPRTWTTQITKIGKKNDLVMSVRAPVGDMAKTDYDVVLGRGVCAIRGNEFIFQLLNKMKINGYWNTLSTGSTFESINSNDIKNAQISIPLPIEQQKISTFFTALDRYITIHQRKLENMQKLKKSLLQQMFV